MSPSWVVATLGELDSEIIGTIFIEKVLKKRVYYPFLSFKHGASVFIYMECSPHATLRQNQSAEL